jgi:hypothetical protein
MGLSDPSNAFECVGASGSRDTPFSSLVDKQRLAGRSFPHTLSPMIYPNPTARSRFLVTVVLSGLVALAGCGGGDKDESSNAAGSAADAHSAPAQHPDARSGRATMAGVSFVAPSHWTPLGPSGMRKEQWRLAAVEGDSAAAEVNLFYFGENSGGGVQANLDRWIGQMVLPEGADPATAIERATFTTPEGLKGHIVALNGGYKSGGGRPMGGDGEVLEGHRLVGVVLEGPQGSLFFKLTGPEATARAMEKDLRAMVGSARKA